MASGKCPSGGPAKAVLYNHMGKTGGTPMKKFLMAATGCSNAVTAGKQEGCPVINEDAHIHPSRIGPEGALIIQDDTAQTLQVTAADEENYFIIGLIRRPCDYLLSSWSFSSAKTSTDAGVGPHYKWGIDPPYDNDADRERFGTWVKEISKHRDEGSTWVGGASYESVLLRDRIPDTSLVHCWVRTHDMVKDLEACMKQYQACGGTAVEPLGLSSANVSDVQESLTSAYVQPTQHASCNSFFKNATVKETVMASELPLVSQFNLGECCSD